MLCSSEVKGHTLIPGRVHRCYADLRQKAKVTLSFQAEGPDATLILDVSAILYIYDPVFPMCSMQLINNQRRQTIKKKKVSVCVWGGVMVRDYLDVVTCRDNKDE